MARNMDQVFSTGHENEFSPTYILIISSISFLVALVSLLAVCSYCCKRRRNQKSELAGIEGVVKLKQLDDSTLNVSIDATDSSDALNPRTKPAYNKNATLPVDAFKLTNGFHDFELKRSSAAPHRSLPDIPAVIEATGAGDNNSELYATVGDKLQEKDSEKSPAAAKKLSNISQHSSLSQADDVSSPYARVKSPQHAYDKLKKSKHPYAQVIQPATAGCVAQVENIDDEYEEEEEDETTIENPISHRESSNNDLLSTAESHLDASAAISGRISASQELPYMTPPIMNIVQPPNQHFSGDSQDSSKGYTSISVREPLANIIAQTNAQKQRRRREIQDSHYATVSDDSDEMYAAIEDPNNTVVDLYTSGSETYAQIQAPMTVSVEINAMAPPQLPPATSTVGSQTSTMQSMRTTRPVSHHEESQIDTLKSIHSRQASSSSCTSSIGNVGSPKPEKRQANSPLPPTPQSKKDSNNNSNKTRQEVEGMYAKVIKKNKLSSVPFESTSPNLSKRHELNEDNDVIDGITELRIVNEYETIDKKKRNRIRNDRDGYETIPADRNNNKEHTSIAEMPHYAQIGEKIKNNDEAILINNDPKYETLKLTNNAPNQLKKNLPSGSTTDSDYDPNYEIVINKERISSSSSTSSTLIDEGYSQIGKKLKEIKDFSDEESIPGYSTIKKLENDYSSIGENLVNKMISNDELDTESNIYSSIPAVMHSVVVSPSTDSNSSEMHLEYEQITSSVSVTPTTANNNYETLSIDESSTATEDQTTMRFLKENPYERLHNEKTPECETITVISDKAANDVDDFFKV